MTRSEPPPAPVRFRFAARGVFGRLGMLGVMVAALLAAGCWEDPVKETLTVDLREREKVTLTVVVELDAASDHQRGTAARRVLDETAADLLAGRHAWHDRFARLGCEGDGTAWERSGGELRRYELHARCGDPSALADLLSDLNVGVELRWEGERGELRLFPGASGPASRDERRKLEREIDAWSTAVGRYVEAALVVARRAAAEPGRAPAIWKAVLDQEDEDLKQLTADEKAEVVRLGETMEEVYDGFARRDDAAESLDARARRAFDPLPDRVEVVTPGPASEVVGFVSSGDGRWAAPDRGLAAALAGLAGRWLDPDPLWTLVHGLRAESEIPVDMKPFLAGSIVRSEEPPDAIELRREIAALLAPPAELSLAWRLPPKGP